MLTWGPSFLSPQDFGLDVPAFRTLVGDDCPLPFLLLAIHCCSVRASPSLPSALSVSRRVCPIPGDGRKTQGPTSRALSEAAPVSAHQMEPSARAPFTEITHHLEWILEQLSEPAPLTRAPLTHNQGK